MPGVGRRGKSDCQWVQGFFEAGESVLGSDSGNDCIFLWYIKNQRIGHFKRANLKICEFHLIHYKEKRQKMTYLGNVSYSSFIWRPLSVQSWGQLQIFSERSCRCVLPSFLPFLSFLFRRCVNSARISLMGNKLVLCLPDFR